jgi:hypothetical protein
MNRVGIKIIERRNPFRLQFILARFEFFAILHTHDPTKTEPPYASLRSDDCLRETNHINRHDTDYVTFSDADGKELDILHARQPGYLAGRLLSPGLTPHSRFKVHGAARMLVDGETSRCIATRTSKSLLYKVGITRASPAAFDF